MRGLHKIEKATLISYSINKKIFLKNFIVFNVKYLSSKCFLILSGNIIALVHEVLHGAKDRNNISFLES